MRKIWIGAGLIVVAAVAAAYFFYPSQRTADAAEIVETCESHPQGAMTCYEKEVPKLYPAMDVPDLLSLIREIRRIDPSYQFCHVLAHKIGEGVVAADPDSWIDAIPLNPSDGLCSNGYIHGVIVGRFRDEVLDEKTLAATIPDFKRACEPREDWDASPLDQAICYHGMGHLFMFITSADMPRSLAVCDIIGQSPTGNFLRVCQEGVFMQIYQPLEPDDFALLELLPEKPTKDNYRRLCAAYENDPQEGACLREAWPLFREGIVDGTQAAEFCTGHPNKNETSACYDTVSAIIGRMSLSDSGKAANACSALPEEWQVPCFAAAAQAVLEEDRSNGSGAVALCKRASEGIAARCLGLLAQRASFVFSDPVAHGNFCALLPEENRNVCEAQLRR